MELNCFYFCIPCTTSIHFLLKMIEFLCPSHPPSFFDNYTILCITECTEFTYLTFHLVSCRCCNNFCDRGKCRWKKTLGCGWPNQVRHISKPITKTAHWTKEGIWWIKPMIRMKLDWLTSIIRQVIMIISSTKTDQLASVLQKIKIMVSWSKTDQLDYTLQLVITLVRWSKMDRMANVLLKVIVVLSVDAWCCSIKKIMCHDTSHSQA